MDSSLLLKLQEENREEKKSELLSLTWERRGKSCLYGEPGIEGSVS
jgi:hypothetical protein